MRKSEWEVLSASPPTFTTTLCLASEIESEPRHFQIPLLTPKGWGIFLVSELRDTS